MADEICPGPCNNAYRRARALYEAARKEHDAAAARATDAGSTVPDPPEAPSIRPWFGSPIWCLRCHAMIRAALSDIGDLGAMVAALPPGVRPAVDSTRERVKVSGSRPALSPSPGGDTLDELTGWLRSWEAVVKRTDERPRRGILATERHAILSVLIELLDATLIREDVAVSFGEETLAWHRQLIAAAHAAREAKHVKKPCPSCKRYTLWERPGQPYIECVYEDCHRRLTREELDNAA